MLVLSTFCLINICFDFGASSFFTSKGFVSKGLIFKASFLFFEIMKGIGTSDFLRYRGCAGSPLSFTCKQNGFSANFKTSLFLPYNAPPFPQAQITLSTFEKTSCSCLLLSGPIGGRTGIQDWTNLDFDGQFIVS